MALGKFVLANQVTIIKWVTVSLGFSSKTQLNLNLNVKNLASVRNLCHVDITLNLDLEISNF